MLFSAGKPIFRDFIIPVASGEQLSVSASAVAVISVNPHTPHSVCCKGKLKEDGASLTLQKKDG